MQTQTENTNKTQALDMHVSSIVAHSALWERLTSNVIYQAMSSRWRVRGFLFNGVCVAPGAERTFNEI